MRLLRKDFSHVAVAQLFLPKTYYNIQSPNNVFYLTEAGAELTITIPSANYTRTSFKAVVQSIMNSTGTYVYTLTIPNVQTTGDDGKYTITVTAPIVQPILRFNKLQMARAMGFNNDTSYQFSANVLKSENVIDLNNENTIILNSNIVENGILQEVFVSNSQNFSAISYQNNDIIRTAKKIIYAETNSPRFYITDEDNNPINTLNGLETIFSLIFMKLPSNIQ